MRWVGRSPAYSVVVVLSDRDIRAAIDAGARAAHVRASAADAIRNRGAFAFVHLDASAPEHLELDVGRDARWRIAASGTTGAVELGPDAGGFAGFDAGRLALEQEIDPAGAAGGRRPSGARSSRKAG